MSAVSTQAVVGLSSSGAYSGIYPVPKPLSTSGLQSPVSVKRDAHVAKLMLIHMEGDVNTRRPPCQPTGLESG